MNLRSVLEPQMNSLPPLYVRTPHKYIISPRRRVELQGYRVRHTRLMYKLSATVFW